jgi:hypothetical protein
MVSTSACDPIAKRWIRDAQHLWQVQENLLQSYRTYLIVLNSLLAAGSCTIMVRLYSEIAETASKVAETSSKLNVSSLKLFLIVIMILLLMSFTAFAFGSIILMGRVISNRGFNVHLCQYIIIQLQLGEFFQEALPKISDEGLAEMSLLSAFKTVEHPKKHERGFVWIDKNHARLGDFLWRIKNTDCKTAFNSLDFTRRKIYWLLTRMFFVIWGLISLFWLLATGWLICHCSGADYLLHPCHLFR